MAFDAAMFNTLKEIRDRQDRLLEAQQRTNELLAQLASMLGQPNGTAQQWWPPADAGPVR